MMAVPVHADYDASVTQQVQQKLNEAGFDCGMPDGVAGAKTEEAIRAFQESRNLTADGVISEELLESLGLSEGEQENGGEDVGFGYLDEDSDRYYMPGDRYYTPGEDLLLFNLDGFKVILKGERSEATDEWGIDHSIALDVEVVNGYSRECEISVGMDYEGNSQKLPVIMNYNEEYYAPDDLCVVPANSTAEGVIYGEMLGEPVSLEELQSVELYFAIYNSDLTEKTDLGPFTVHYQEKDAAAGTEGTVASAEFDVPDMPERLVNAGGTIPGTLEELRAQMLDGSQFDIYQLQTVYEQCDFPKMLEEIKENGTCTVLVTGEDWSGNFRYWNSNLEDTTVPLDISQSEDGITVTRDGDYDFDAYPSHAMTLCYYTDENHDSQVKILDHIGYTDAGPIRIATVEIRYNLLTEENESAAYDYCVTYDGLKDGGNYQVTSSITTPISMLSWIGEYDENGKLVSVEYEEY